MTRALLVLILAAAAVVLREVGPVGSERVSLVLDGVGAQVLDAGEVYLPFQPGAVALELEEPFRQRPVVAAELLDRDLIVEVEAVRRRHLVAHLLQLDPLTGEQPLLLFEIALGV